jgi:TPR repeat protein
VKWWKAASEQGDTRAQRWLGLMYAMGKGVVQDSVRAYMRGGIAASNGGDRLRDYVAKTMTPAQIAEAQKPARECVRKKYKGC